MDDVRRGVFLVMNVDRDERRGTIDASGVLYFRAV